MQSSAMDTSHPINHDGKSSELASAPSAPSASSPTTQPAMISDLSSELLDPTTQVTFPVFPLAANNLSDLVEYKNNADGDAPELSNSLISKVALPRGSHFCFITSHRPVPATTWSSIQTSEHSHVEFDSALVYANHSCSPTLELHISEPGEKSGESHKPHIETGSVLENILLDGGMSWDHENRGDLEIVDTQNVAGEFRVARDRDLQIGDDLTWFYPSTEWISPRPFRCMCGAGQPNCISWQRGAKFLSQEQADSYFLNPHVERLRKKWCWGKDDWNA